MNQTLNRSITVLAAFLLAFGDNVSAQEHALDAGSFRVGGTGSFSRTSTSVGASGSSSETRIMLSPLAQYFVMPGLALGATMTLDRRSAEGFAVTSLGIGPAGTYYFHTPARAVHPYVAAAATFGRTTIDTPQQDARQTLTGMRGAGGLLWLLAPNVGLTGELFYDRLRSSGRVEGMPLEVPRVTTESIGFAAGFSIFLF